MQEQTSAYVPFSLLGFLGHWTVRDLAETLRLWVGFMYACLCFWPTHIKE